MQVRNLRMHFPVRSGMFGKAKGSVKAVDDVSLSLYEHETLGLVGESGCGKTTLGRCLVRAYQPTAGEILYTEGDTRVDLTPLEKRDLLPYRGKLRMICQDPYTSLNPRMTVLDILGEPMRILERASGKEVEARVARLLTQVGLRPEYMRRYPHAFSGGQRQRIGIAHAIATSPRIIVADEAVSALDVSVRAQILELFQQLAADLGLTFLFVSHDLSVVEYIADRVAVMYVGHLVEVATTADLYGTPKHPYTEALMSAVPVANPRRHAERIVLEGDVPNPANPPSGCTFHPRCRYATDVCATEVPELRTVGEGHQVACHRAEELSLRGVRG